MALEQELLKIPRRSRAEAQKMPHTQRFVGNDELAGHTVIVTRITRRYWKVPGAGEVKLPEAVKALDGLQASY